MKKTTIIIAAAILAMGTQASAGEIGGNGKPVPGGAQGRSECSFSGINDTPEDGFGFVQVYGFVMKLFGIEPGSPLHPGNACKGN